MRGSVAGPRFDDAMTTVAVCVLEGDGVACLVTSRVIRWLPKAGRTEARLATSWLLLPSKRGGSGTHRPCGARGAACREGQGDERSAYRRAESGSRLGRRGRMRLGDWSQATPVRD